MITIEDRLAILDLSARYNYAVDSGASADWADTFTEDGVFDGPAGHAEGRAELIAFCDGLARDYPGAMHFTDNHLFEPAGDGVRHRCFLSFQVPREGGTDVLLLAYEDDLVRVGGAWRFRSRRVAPLTAS